VERLREGGRRERLRGGEEGEAEGGRMEWLRGGGMERLS